MKKNRIAIVVQRYGEEVNGGAELMARWLAEHLTAIAEIHVITTCAVDYTSWENTYVPGDSIIQGVHVHRFPVDKPRNWRRSQKNTFMIFNQPHSLFDEHEWIKEQGPYSTQLLAFIEATEQYFDVFIFFTYVYATSFFGLPLVPNKAILVPTAHDEPYLYLPAFRSLFHLPQAIVFNTEPEQELVNQVMKTSTVPQVVAGVGINVPEGSSADRFRKNYPIEGDFLLYVGRISSSKNIPELIEQFGRFRRSWSAPLKLVLIGKSQIQLPDHPDIVHLGFVSEQDKFDAISAATVVAIPSYYESLSMIALESWLMETPVLVNGHCAVLKHQCRISNGGLFYVSYDEFSAALTHLLGSSQLRDQMGRSGRAFTVAHYDWDTIIAKFGAVIEQIAQ